MQGLCLVTGGWSGLWWARVWHIHGLLWALMGLLKAVVGRSELWDSFGLSVGYDGLSRIVVI